MRAAILSAILLLGSGCESLRYGCFNACLSGSGGYKGTTHIDPPDRSTDHCEALPGQVYRGENGDELAFREGRVEWTHGGSRETRTWECEINDSVVISGFANRSDGYAFVNLVAFGVLTFQKANYRIVGGVSDYVFPCEKLLGFVFFAETGDALAFAPSGKTVVWKSGATSKTLVWTCNDRDLRFRDGTIETEVIYVPEERNLPSSFLRWEGLKFEKSRDGSPPVFPCQLLAGRTFRCAATGDVLAFGSAMVEWRRASGFRTLSWTCFDGKVTFTEGATRTEGQVNPTVTRLCYESYCYDVQAP